MTAPDAMSILASVLVLVYGLCSIIIVRQSRLINRQAAKIENRNEVIDWQRRRIDEYAAKDAARHAMLSAAGKKGAAAREANRA